MSRRIYTTDQAEGAIPNGTRIVKVNSEAEDAHVDGAPGVVIGSMAEPEHPGRFGYFIEWDDMPGLPVGIVGHRIAVAE